MKFVVAISILVSAVLFGCSSPVSNRPAPRPSTTIAADTSWPAGGTYHITGDLYIKALLNIGDGSQVVVDSDVTIYVGSTSGAAILMIGKGTVFSFGKGASIYVGSDKPGTLIAHGTATDSIRFTRLPSAAFWGGGTGYNSGGIRIGSSALNQTSLTYCVVENANVGIKAFAPGVEISNCTVRSCTSEGIVLYGGSRDPANFLNNVLTGNGGYGLAIGTENVGTLSLTNILSGNVKNGIRVNSGPIIGGARWINRNIPYVIFGTVGVSSDTGVVTLTISPGCRLEFVEGWNSGITIYSQGALIAQGNPNDSIVFTKNLLEPNPDKTPFYGIHINEQGYSQSSFRYCIVEYATSGIQTYRGTEISNCTIRNCKQNGIDFLAKSYYDLSYYQHNDTGYPISSASFLSNVISGNGGYAISIFAHHVGNLSGIGDFSGNGMNGILVYGDKISASATWKKQNVPYVINGVVDIGAANGSTLTIDPGCRLLFAPTGSYIQVGNSSPGSLVAQGSPVDSIIFSRDTTAGWWGYAMGGILIGHAASTATSLEFCTISYATTGIYAGAAVTIQNCWIHDNKQYGINFTATGLDQRVTNNTFGNNPMGDIYQ